VVTKYVIITPAKNEEEFIEHTLNSVCSQTHKPIEWIIVDDGSTDQTSSLVERYMMNNSWIKLIKSNNLSEKRAGGPKVVRAFNKGYDVIRDKSYDFIVKLDADLTLPSNYFEVIGKTFMLNEMIGLCGGYCVGEKKGKLLREMSASFHVRGAVKAYRKQCFIDIGGLKPVWNWDGLDELMAMYMGWEVKVLPLEVVHHRETSKEYNPLLQNFLHGKEYYRMGHGTVLLLIKSLHTMINTRPLFFGGIVFVGGFVWACIKGENKIVDEKAAGFIRRFQYERIWQTVRKVVEKS
jgi:glycosyltransferase involved in cell wall biosynthesis